MDMLATIFNSKLVVTLMLSLRQHGEIYASGVAREANLTLSAVQKQLARFEQAGLLASRTVGKTRVYRFNPDNPYIHPLTMMLKIARPTSSSASRPRRPKPPPIEVDKDEKLWLY
ncbi:MAG: winged helix-turn-helix domain-containing protein [Verrucomicrobiales bacterium]|jgi:DNA-binding transcriptional ArsR family regulator|nr:winged helix-turn-helix domain-containing protein [Verrucomicrobiales bacterium]